MKTTTTPATAAPAVTVAVAERRRARRNETESGRNTASVEVHDFVEHFRRTVFSAVKEFVVNDLALLSAHLSGGTRGVSGCTTRIGVI